MGVLIPTPRLLPCTKLFDAAKDFFSLRTGGLRKNGWDNISVRENRCLGGGLKRRGLLSFIERGSPADSLGFPPSISDGRARIASTPSESHTEGAKRSAGSCLPSGRPAGTCRLRMVCFYGRPSCPPLRVDLQVAASTPPGLGPLRVTILRRTSPLTTGAPSACIGSGLQSLSGDPTRPVLILAIANRVAACCDADDSAEGILWKADREDNSDHYGRSNSRPPARAGGRLHGSHG